MNRDRLIDSGMALPFPSNASAGRRATVGADRAYDAKDFVKKCRKMKATPSVARKKNSAIC
jgi:hypothetical protein